MVPLYQRRRNGKLLSGGHTRAGALADRNKGYINLDVQYDDIVTFTIDVSCMIMITDIGNVIVEGYS